MISTSDGIYYANITNPVKWIKLGNVIFKSFDIVDFVFKNGSKSAILTGLSNNQNIIQAFMLDLKNDTLISISAGEIPSGVDQVVNLIAFNTDTASFLFVSGLRGLVEQWQLYDPGWGQVDGRVVRQFSSPIYNRFLALSDGILAGAYPDKGLWTFNLRNKNQVLWQMDKLKSFKGRKIHSLTLATIKGKLSVLTLFEGGDILCFNPHSGKQVSPVKLNTSNDMNHAEFLLTDNYGRLNMLFRTESGWILETYVSD